MLLIYTDCITSRLKYTLETVFDSILSLPYALTSDKEFFIKSDLPCLNYSEQRFGNEVFIKSHELLTAHNVKPQKTEVFHYEACPVFFRSSDDSDLPYDPFACIFYMISRYEEYLPHSKDIHGRFEADQSIAFQNNFLRKPVADLWAWQLAGKLNASYPGLVKGPLNYQFTPTFDIDQAWFIRNKSLARIAYGLTAGLNKFRLGLFFKKLGMLAGWEADPFDVFGKMEELHCKAGIKPLVFFHMGNYGKYDKSISHRNKAFRSLIRRVASFAQVGIHPSYAAFENPETLKEEKRRLEDILQQPVTMSRQHYLRLSLPETYRNLISLGIRDDYTMGYATDAGFRAGICRPFYFYDLLQERKTELLIHPFMAMDVTLKNYLQLDTQKAVGLTLQLADEAKRCKGHFMTLWHNESLSGFEGWAGWPEAYSEILNRVKA